MLQCETLLNFLLFMLKRYSVLLVTIYLVFTSLEIHAEPPIVAVASNLTAPLTEISEIFQVETGEPIRLSFGSSGNLSRQIVQGAPYDIFISASETYINFLKSQDVEINQQIKYMNGDIGFYLPPDSIYKNLESDVQIISALKFGNQGRLVIANPEHAPYGIAAIEALQNGGVWALSTGNLILSESVAQIVPYIHTGNIDLAIIPKSFVLQNALYDSGTYISINPSWYQPITQYVVILNDSNPVALNFMAFLTSKTALTILTEYGYQPAGNQ